MKRTTKLSAAVIACFFGFSLCVASCKASNKTNPPAKPDETVTAPLTDGNRNDDYELNKPATPSTDNSDTEQLPGNTGSETSGFLIPESTTALIVEGLKDSYSLNAENAYLCISETDFTVYLSDDGVKGNEVPAENCELKLYKGDCKLNLNDRITVGGEYELVCILVDAVYENGTAADSKNVFARVKFNVVNPAVALRFVSGTTEQTASKTDKISASWAFEIQFANGGVKNVDTAEITLPQLETQSVGNHVATVTVNGLQTEVNYTVNPPPAAVHAFKISLKESVSTETENGEITFGLNDFELLVTADSQYSPIMRAAFIQDGNELESLTVAASEEPVSVKIKAVFEYAVDGETFTQVMYGTVQLLVTQKPKPEPDVPLPDKNFNLKINSETLSSIPPVIENEVSLAKSGKGELILAPQEGVCVTFGEAIHITNDYSVSDCFTALSFDLTENATVKLTALTEGFAAIGVITPDGEHVCKMEYIDYDLTEIAFTLSSGSYRLYVTGDDASIFSIEVIFG